MQVERWDIDTHYAILDSWMRARGSTLGDVRLLPRTGFIVDRSFAAFLYKTDSSVAFLDSALSNPDVPARRRLEAFDVLIAELRAEARRLGYSHVAGTPSVRSLVNRLRRVGFAVVEGCSYVVGGV